MTLSPLLPHPRGQAQEISMIAIGLVADGPITVETRHRASVVCMQLLSAAYRHLSTEENTAVRLDLGRALSALSIGAATCKQYTEALTSSKADAA
jgi:hypothetical protein